MMKAIEILNILAWVMLVMVIVGGYLLLKAVNDVLTILFPPHPNNKPKVVKYTKVYDTKRDAKKAIEECPPSHRIPIPKEP